MAKRQGKRQGRRAPSSAAHSAALVVPTTEALTCSSEFGLGHPLFDFLLHSESLVSLDIELERARAAHPNFELSRGGEDGSGR